MPRARWLQNVSESTGRRIALAPLVPAGWFYGAAARWNRKRHQSNNRRRTLPIRVVSVGNLVVGGTAKTPMAAWLARSLHRRGLKVALASRGYGRQRQSGTADPVVAVSDGKHVFSRAEWAGDEPMLLAGRVPGVPVLVGADRYQVGLRAFSAFGAEVLVLDDGFQHHALTRDIDIVTIDGRFGFGNGYVLPRGPLREPFSALRVVDAFAVIDGPLQPADRARLEQAAPSAPRFDAERIPAALRPLRGGVGEPVDRLDGAEVGVLAAIARPDSLVETLGRLGARVVAQRTFGDHHRYRAADLRGLSREAPLWVTTEKDAVKITPEWVGGADLRVLSLDLRVADPEAVLDWISRRLN
jgi:tetraacyldisaccharide 4'-kinase